MGKARAGRRGFAQKSADEAEQLANSNWQSAKEKPGI